MVGVADAQTRPVGDAPTTHPQRAASEDSALEPGDALGRYVLGERLGQGGMGSVYRAHDPELGRDVAIKVMRRRLSGAQETSLLEEARALAVLSHPHVVPVFDVGLADKTIFVAMELVEGQTLRQWLETRQPSQPERIDALLAAGRGLAAAHQAGIVHRDVKPANVLIGNDGRVRVADFGLAMGAERTERSSGQSASRDSGSDSRGYVEGTPRYMAPEQHAGAVPEPAADQFSFCLMAVELLTGDKPFAELRGRALVSAKHRPPEATPPHGVPRRIWTVLRRGLDPVPDERWPSMRALLAALERTSRPRRLWPVIVPLALVGVWLGAQRDEPQRVAGPCSDAAPSPWTNDQYAAAERGFLSSEHEGAEAAWERVSSRLDDFATRWTAAVTQTCGQADDPSDDPRLACLERAGGRARAFVELLAKTRASEVDAAVHSVWTATQLDPCQDSAAQLERSDEAWVVITQAQALQYMGRVEEAEAMLTDTLDRLRSERTWSSVQARRMRGLYRLNNGNLELAHADLEQAYHEASAAGLDDIAFGAAMSLSGLESEHRGDPRAAEEWLRHAEAAVQRGELEGIGFEADLLNARAGVDLAAGRFADAIVSYAKEVDLRRRQDGPPHLAGALQELATAQSLAGRVDEAIGSLQESLSIWQDVGLGEAIDGAAARGSLATVLAEAGQYDEAIAEHDRSIEIYRQLPTPPERAFGLAYVNRGVALTYAGRHEDAIESLRSGHEILEAVVGADNPDTVRARLNLGVALLGAGHLEEAQQAYIAVHEWSQAALGEEHPMTGASLANVAEVLLRQGKLRDSARMSEGALASLDASVGRRHSFAATTLANLGEAQVRLGERETGFAKLDEALRIHQSASTDPKLAREVAGRVLELLGDGEGPQDLRSRCEALVDEHQ